MANTKPPTEEITSDIVIRFQYSPQLLQAAHLLHYRTFFPLRGRALLLVGVVVIVCGAVLLLVPVVNAWMGPALLVYGLALIGFHYYYFATMGRRVYRRLQEYHEPFEVRIGEQGITLNLNRQDINIPWNRFVKSASDDQYTLLYPNDKAFFVFPRRFFAPGDYERFRQRVEQQLRKPD